MHFRMVYDEAVCVIAGTMPIEVLAVERKQLYEQQSSTPEEQEKKKKNKKAERPKNDSKEKAVQTHTTTELKPAPPNAFKIRKCGEPTYADNLGILKGAPGLKALQEKFTRIELTKAGELLLEIDDLVS